MRSYAQIQIFTEDQLETLHRAERLVKAAPTFEPDIESTSPGDWIRYHELARAVGLVIGLPVQDGRYGFVEHSWLWVGTAEEVAEAKRGYPSRYNFPPILDVYVPGSLPQVQLVEVAHTGLPARYGWAAERTDIRVNVVDFLVRLFHDTELNWRGGV